jgi:hypothetical protein
LAKKPPKSISLLDPESRGGHINIAGMNYQADVALAYLPAWLAHDGFDSMVVEATGDMEARFFDLDCEWAYICVEAKSYSLSKAEFWKEIRRFRQIANADVNIKRHFVLVCPDARGVRPILEALKRVKGPSTFYAGSPIWQVSFEDFVLRVKKSGGSRDDAEFLFYRVDVDLRANEASNSGVVSFRAAVSASLDWLDRHARSDQLDRIDRMYTDLHLLLTRELCQTISRKSIELLIAQAMGIESLQAILPPIRIFTKHQDTHSVPEGAIGLDWREFFATTTNIRADQAHYDLSTIGSQLDRIHKWIANVRDHRRIQLQGHRRLSGSFAIGAMFPAVSKFVIETRVNTDDIWRTDEHAMSLTPTPIILSDKSSGSGEDGVIAISCVNTFCISADEIATKMNLGGSGALVLHIQNPITSAREANLVVHHLKQFIESWLQANQQIKQVHMTFRAPAFLVLLLGHRLNLKQTMITYEWGGRQYSPICSISG